MPAPPGVPDTLSTTTAGRATPPKPAPNAFAPGATVPTPHIGDAPHPTLEAAGFTHGGIHEFNDRIQKVTDAYQNAHGTPPPAGLAFDVARSQVPPTQYTNLFSPLYTDPRASRAAGAVAQHQKQNPADYFETRLDGVQQPVSNILQLMRRSYPDAGKVDATTAPVTSKQQYGPAEPQHAFLKAYPMVTMGVLPIPSFGDLEDALAHLDEPVPTVNTSTVLPGTPASEIPQLQQEAQQEQFRNDAPYVRTLKQAQIELNTAMHTSLPTTGVFNQTWVDALHNWMKTTDYAKQELQYQAGQDGFGTNVNAYVKAWNQRERVRSHGLYGWLLGYMPLPLYGHGGFWDDLASLPGYLKGSSNNPLNIGLHSLTRTAGVTLDVIGGTVTQAKAYAAAATTAARDVYEHKGPTQTLEEARAQLHANPSWMRALGFGFVPVHEGHTLSIIDQATNVAGDLILLRKPSITGERVAAGDVAAAAKSDYLSAAAHWSYNDMLKYGQDGIGRASARLESNQGGRALVGRVAKAVKNGEVAEEQFKQWLAELYANGHVSVTVEGKTYEVTGPVLSRLRNDKIPAPAKSGQAWIKAKSAMRRWSDDNLYTYQGNPVGSSARSFAAGFRNRIAHYVPPRLGYMDEILPERVFNFVLKNKLGDDPALMANRLESILVKAQGTENIPRIQQVQRTIERLYFDKYDASAVGAKDDPFKAVLSTEAPSVFHFPSGGEKELVTAGDRIAAQAQRVNAVLNKAAKLHARIILSGFPFIGAGGFSLFWKHAVGDTLRSWVGGGLFDIGLGRWKNEINTLADEDAEASRILGSFRQRAKLSEANWALGRGGNTLSRDFATGEKFGEGPYMTAAGGYLRRMLDDPALDAYLAHDRQALVDLILNDRTYRGMWHAAQRGDPDLTAEDYADLLKHRYEQVNDALDAQGLTWDDAKAVLSENRGAKADSALGKWIKAKKLDFEVTKGQVEKLGTFDAISGKWVGDVIMKPNKWNRGNFAENILAQTYRDLRESGWEQKEALETATSVAGALTKYHMLDFANRLQIEQDLRWVSYFATKHRLYFKWVLGTFLRHPGYAAATYDFSKTLNQYGGWTLPFKVFGMSWYIPLERLVWVPGREYDETSPLALAVFNFIKSGGSLDAVVKGAVGTQGNVITRSDTAILLGTKLLKIETGKAPATYGYAIAGLDKTTASYVTKALNEYQTTYFQQHHHYAPQATAVKLILLEQLGEEYQRANLILPIVPEQGRTSEQQALMNQFEQLNDPRARARFLNKHPDLANIFGIYQNPRVELHNRALSFRWTKAMDAYRAGRTDLYQEAEKTGHWTPAMELKRRALAAALNTVRNKLLIEDAQQWGINTHGMVPDGQTVPFGPWGKVMDGNPTFDPEHALNTLFPKLAPGSSGDIIGPLQREMQAELNKLDDPKYVAASGYTQQEVATRREELLRKLAVFSSYPSDALGVLHDKYQAVVNKYWAQESKRYNAISSIPSGQRTQANAEFALWRDEQDEPVTIDGVKFPSPVRMAWALLDHATYQQRLSLLGGKALQDLADYELDLLGVKHPDNVSAALAAIQTAVEDYHTANPGKSLKSTQILAVAKQINQQPGYHGFLSYYVNTLTAPRIQQFEQTNLYRNMPTEDRATFQEIAQPAIAITREIKANGHSEYYSAAWRKIVQQTIDPWLADPANKDLAAYLKPFGPNFLDDLVTVTPVG